MTQKNGRNRIIATVCTVLLAMPAVAAMALGGCADGSANGTGSIQLGLRDAVGGWLRLRIFAQDPGAALDGATTFDTNCLDAQSRTYELTNVPAGIDQWVVIESFDQQDCAQTSRVEIGYRGKITIPEGATAPYYHVPLYEEGGITTLPETLNISASQAERIELCAPGSNACDKFSPMHACYDVLKPEYWCVPACTTTTDCQGFHPRAICQASTGWCLLNSPHPLNLAEPRAFGHGGTLSNGDAVFVAGFGKIAAGRLLPGNEHVETFNQRTGLFEKRRVTGLEGWKGAGLAGYATLGSDRFAVVGGLNSVQFTWSGSGSSVEILVKPVAAEDFTSDIVIMDLSTNVATVSTIPRPLAEPMVVALDANRLLVMGGRSVDASGAPESTNQTWVCNIGPNNGATCTAAGTMTAARIGGAATCIDAGCERVLVVGGRGDLPAEILDVAGAAITATALTIDGPLGPVTRVSLCGMRLVGGAAGVGVGTQNPLALSVSGNTLTATELGPAAITVWPAVASDADGDCWVAGGIDAAGVASAQVYKMTDQGKAPNPLAFSRARFGAIAAWISDGPISGAILYGGGVNLTGSDPNGSFDIVRGVEVLKP